MQYKCYTNSTNTTKSNGKTIRNLRICYVVLVSCVELVEPSAFFRLLQFGGILVDHNKPIFFFKLFQSCWNIFLTETKTAKPGLKKRQVLGGSGKPISGQASTAGDKIRAKQVNWQSFGHFLSILFNAFNFKFQF